MDLALRCGLLVWMLSTLNKRRPEGLRSNLWSKISDFSCLPVSHPRPSLGSESQKPDHLLLGLSKPFPQDPSPIFLNRGWPHKGILPHTLSNGRAKASVLEGSHFSPPSKECCSETGRNRDSPFPC